MEENTDVSYRFLSSLFGLYGVLPSARVELRCFPRGGGRPLQSWHGLTVAGLESAAEKARTLGADHDVYCAVLPRKAGEGSAAGIRLCHWLWVDIDGGDAGPEGSADLLKSSVKRLRIPEPSMIVLSGGGLHAYWPLAACSRCHSLDEQERVRDTLRRLVRGIGSSSEEGGAYADRASAEPARILRVPGTFNHKRRDPRPVKLLRCLTEPKEGAEAHPLVWWRLRLPQEATAPLRSTHPAGYRGDCRTFDTPPPKVQEKLSGVPDGMKHYSMMKVAVWARKEGLDEGQIRAYAAQVAQSSGVNLSTAQQQRHLEDIVTYVMDNVHPAPK